MSPVLAVIYTRLRSKLDAVDLLRRREEKFHSKIQRVSSALANCGSHEPPFIREKHNHRALAGVN